MQIDTELIGLIFAAFAGFLLTIGALILLIRKMGEAVAASNQTMVKQSETIIKLNDELQETIKDRQNWRIEQVKLEAEINSLKAAATKEVERNDRQFTGMQTQIAQIRTQRDRLQGELEAIARKVGELENENKDLRDKVNALERENKDLRGEREILIQKLDNLTRKLDAEITSNNDLRCELEKLRNRVRDLPSTDDVTKAAAEVANQQDDPDPDPDPPGPKAPIRFESETKPDVDADKPAA